MPQEPLRPPVEIVGDLWASLGLPPEALAGLALEGAEPVLPSSFRVDALAQAAIAAAALAAAELHRRRTGTRQQVAVGLRHAAAEFRSERHLSVAGAPPAELWDPLAGAYRTGDGRFVRIHTNFAHHRDGILALLGCANERAAVAAALAGWTGEAFEAAATEAGLVVALMRSFAEWDSHPQGRATAGLPLVALEPIGAAPPEPPGPAARPLEGLRVLDLTRILAGPVCGRALASHGADVLRVLGPGIPTIDIADIDTGRGKRSAILDWSRDAAAMRELVRGADVIVQSYRPGALARHGFGPAEAAALRPGIVYVSISAYGAAGPWAGKRGFDSLVQTACGLNHAEAEAAGADQPKALPCQALDHGSGFLMAFGAIAALLRRGEAGGSWHVRVSLDRTAHWLRGLGRLPDGLARSDPGAADLDDLVESSPSGYGPLRAIRPAARMSETPARLALPSMPFGSHAPVWLDR